MSRRKKKLIGNQKRLDMNHNRRLDSQDFKILRSTKESYSNWRADLPEVMEHIDNKNSTKITEKGTVDNKVRINPSSQDSSNRQDINSGLGESLKILGGTLLEMTEYSIPGILDEITNLDLLLIDSDLLEEIVYNFMMESLEEGLDLEEIQSYVFESIDHSLSVLSEDSENSRKVVVLTEIKQLIKNIVKGVSRAAGYVAGAGVRAIKGIGREVGGGYHRGRHGAGGSRDYDHDDHDDYDYVPVRRSSGQDRVGGAVSRGLRSTLAHGAGYATGAAVRGARSLGREFGSGYQRGRTGTSGEATPSSTPTTVQRTPQPYSGIGGGKSVEVAGKPGSPRLLPPASKIPERKPQPYSGIGGGKPVEVAGKPEPQKLLPGTSEKPKPKGKSKKTTVPAQPAATPSRASRRRREPNPQKPGAPSLGDLLKSEQYASRSSNLVERITKDTPIGTVVSDFVHSRDRRFRGKSEKKRIEMGLAAAYAAHRKGIEEASVTAPTPLNPTTTKPTAQQSQQQNPQITQRLMRLAQLRQKQAKDAAQTAAAERSAAQAGASIAG